MNHAPASLQTLLAAVLGKNAADGSADSKLAAKYTPLWTELLITRATAIYVAPAKDKAGTGGLPVGGGLVIHALAKAAEVEKSLSELIALSSAKPTDISISLVPA